MKFSITKDNLLKPLNIVSNFTADAIAVKKNQIFNNILLDLTEDGLKVVATDGNTDIVTFVPKEKIETIEQTGKVTLSAKYLKSICTQEYISKKTNANDNLIEISFDEQIDQLIVKKGKGTFTFKTLNADDFPKIPSFEPKISFKIKEGELKDIIKTTKFSMGSDDVRNIFNAMLFDVKNNFLNVVTTDSHRLSYNKYQLLDNDAAIDDAMVIIAKKSIGEISALLQNTSKLVTINVAEKTFSLIHEDFTYNSKIVEGNWPKYLGLFPNPNAYLGSFRIDKDILKSLINNISFLCNAESTNWVTVVVEKGKITLKNVTNGHECAEVTSNDVIYDGEYHEMTLNYKFLNDILNNVSSKEVIINIAKASIEIELSNDGSECGELKFIIMLVKL